MWRRRIVMTALTSLVSGISIPADAALLSLENVYDRHIEGFSLSLVDGRSFRGEELALAPGATYYQLLENVPDESSTEVLWAEIYGMGWGVSFAPRYRAFTPGHTVILFTRGNPEQLIALMAVHKHGGDARIAAVDVSEVAEVPEPGTLGLLSLSLLGGARSLRRRFRHVR